MTIVAVATRKELGTSEVYSTLEAAIAEYKNLGYTIKSNLGTCIKNGKIAFSGAEMVNDFGGLVVRSIVVITEHEVK